MLIKVHTYKDRIQYINKFGILINSFIIIFMKEKCKYLLLILVSFAFFLCY